MISWKWSIFTFLFLFLPLIGAFEIRNSRNQENTADFAYIRILE